jgi:broad specificity phosphatase PhoE
MVYLIRHAESQANAGERIACLNSVNLTENGQAQAQKLADNFNDKPDLIVISSFPRTKQTAIPLIKRYPDVPVEIWDVEEFNFLGIDKCKNTVRSQRMKLVEEYYAKNDADHVFGGGAESLNQAAKRADALLEKLAQNKDKKIVIFTHGQFIKTILMRINNIPLTIENFRKIPEIENTGIVEI